jgi:glutaredoxin
VFGRPWRHPAPGSAAHELVQDAPPLAHTARMASARASQPILVLGRDTCEDTVRSMEHLTAHGIPFTYRNVEFDAAADTLLRSHNRGHRVTPTILIGDPERPARVLIEPSDDELDAAIAQVATTG